MSTSDYQWYKEHKICVGCRRKNAVGNFVLCEDCLYKRQEQYHKLPKEEKAKLFKRSKERVKRLHANGRCTRCGKPVCEKSKYLCECCRVKNMMYWRERRKKKDKRTYAEIQEAKERRKVLAYKGYLKYLQTPKGEEHMQKFTKAGREALNKIFLCKSLC